MAGPDLITLDEARATLTIPAAVTNKDTIITGWIDVVTPIIEDIVGPVMPRTCDEWHDGGSDTLLLDRSPILSVETVTESSGPSLYALTEQPLNGSAFNANGYTVDYDLGIIERRSSGSPTAFRGGRRSVHVVYTAGRAEVGAHIRKAACRLLSHLYRQEQQGAPGGGRPTIGGNAAPEQMVTTPSGFAVPRAVVELCGPDARIVGIR